MYIHFPSKRSLFFAYVSSFNLIADFMTQHNYIQVFCTQHFLVVDIFYPFSRLTNSLPTVFLRFESFYAIFHAGFFQCFQCILVEFLKDTGYNFRRTVFLVLTQPIFWSIVIQTQQVHFHFCSILGKTVVGLFYFILIVGLNFLIYESILGQF